MAVPMVGADSRLDNDTVTTSPAEDANFPASRLSDDRTFTVFKTTSASAIVNIVTDAGVGNTVNVNYVMIVGHDLSDPASDGNGAVNVSFQDSADGSAFNPDQFNFMPSNNKIILRTFSTVTNRFFRLRFTRGATFIPSIGQTQWGTRVDMEFGTQVGFDPQEERLVARINRSQTGQILGAISTYSERRATINIPLVTNAFVRSTTAPGGFQDFWDNHATQMLPFVFAWNPGNPGSFEQDAFFCQLEPGQMIQRPLRTPLDSGFRDLEFRVTGLKE